MKKKAYIILTTVLLLISPILYRPFKIHGAMLLDSPFVGVNVKVYDYELNYKYTISGTASENTSNRNTWMCVTWGSSGCKTYQNVTTDGATYTNQSTITFNNTEITGQPYGSKVIYELEFILDNHYIGDFTARVFNGSDYRNVNLVVNGDRVSHIIYDLDDITNVQIRSVNLDLYELDIHWNFPFESLSFITYQFQNNIHNLVGFDQYNYYYFPIFQLENGERIILSYVNKRYPKMYLIIACDQNIGITLSTVENNIDYDTTRMTLVNAYDLGLWTGTYKILKLEFDVLSNGNTYIDYTRNATMKFIPIYFGYGGNVGNDFALVFGLKNELLSNLELIAQGNNNSSSSVSNADTTNQQAQQTFEQEEQLVNNAEEDLQDNLDALDIQNQNNNLFGNSKFVASAQWVKLQFDNLTQNNAFGYMITFSLVIGLALVIIGKLRG